MGQAPEAQKWQSLQTNVAATIGVQQGPADGLPRAAYVQGPVEQRRRGDGAAKRAVGQYFRGDMPALFERLRSKECSASETVSRKVLRDLGNQVDIVRSN